MTTLGGVGCVVGMDWVVLGFVVFSILVEVVCFLLIFSYFNQLFVEIHTASSNFQASNDSVAEAIISLGSLLDDLDEVSGELVRPPQIGDVIAQGLQMFMFQKMQTMLPGGLGEVIPDMINNQRFSEPETWQDVKSKDVQEINTREHSN